MATDLDVHNAAQAFEWWIGCELAFSLVYVFEFASKVRVYGWTQYWRSNLNRFDAFATWVPFLVEVGVVIRVFAYEDENYHHEGASRSEDLLRVLHPQVTRAVLQVRLLRVIRLFTAFQPFQVVAPTFIHLLPSATSLLGTM